MESAGLRQREKELGGEKGAGRTDAIRSIPPRDTDVPAYTIDLSLPPRQRYQDLAAEFKPQLATLPILFDEVVQSLQAKLPTATVQRVARVLLRHVYDKEQNEELIGIQEVTGIEMYLLVAFNVLLDLFMGCTSGGIRTSVGKEQTRMLHFRALDWGMDPLRKVVVQLDFIERAGGPIIASSVTYVGFVGVLTGVRKGLSVSLNFRPNHDASSRLMNFRFYLHHLLVLLGIRPSVSSLLRRCLLPPKSPSRRTPQTLSTLESIERHMPTIMTTAAYLIFNDGQRTMTMEKDRESATCKSASDLITVTNHDEAEEQAPEELSEAQSKSHATLQITGMDGLVEDSIYRKDCAMQLWKKSAKGSQDEKNVPLQKVVKWLDSYPITNEETHYAALMDPVEGKIIWLKRHLNPVL